MMVLSEVDTQKHNPELPDKTEDKHSETPKETDDTNDADDVPMSETLVNHGLSDQVQVISSRYQRSATAFEV